MSSNVCKLCTKVLKERTDNDNVLDFNQPVEQAVFRKKYTTIDHILTISQIIEKPKEYNFKASFFFVDFNKAFVSITHSRYGRCDVGTWDLKKNDPDYFRTTKNSRHVYNLTRKWTPFKYNEG